jgi:hypothetical protein
MAEHFGKILNDKMPALIRRGARTSKLLRDDFRFRTCLIQRYAWCKTRRDLHSNHSGSDVPSLNVRVQNQGCEDVNFSVVRPQRLRQYAEDSDEPPIQIDLFSCNARIGMKSTMPAAKRENYDAIASSDLFRVNKVAAQEWLNPEGWQPVCSYEKSGETLSRGLAIFVEEIGPSSAGDLLERLAVFLYRQILWRRRRVQFTCSICRPHMDEALRFAERQSMKKCGASQSKNGGVCADAKRKGENGDRSESGTLAEDAKGVANILENGFEEMRSARFAALLLDLFEAAEGQAGTTSGFAARHASGYIFFDFIFEVGTKFGVEFRF